MKSFAGVGRNSWITVALLAGLAIGAASLPSMLLTSGLAALLGLVGVVLLRGAPWRSGALLLSALAVSLLLLDAMTAWLWPKPVAAGVVYKPEFGSWAPPDPILGYRLRPDTTVHASATLGHETVYRATYTIDADGWRATPGAPPDADTYLFVGDSCIFSQGVDDDQTLAAQFARANDFQVRTVTLAVPGYAPNHLVRAFDAGLFDRYRDQPVKAVITWIKPLDLGRVSGEETWLDNAPRYALEDGKLRHTGTFLEHRWRDPVDGLAYLARERFAFLKAIGLRRRQALQADLLIALIARLQAVARERYGAPLVVIYQWPDDASPSGEDSESREGFLRAVFARVRALGTLLVSVGALMDGTDVSQQIIVNDGHPTALTHQRIAVELKRRLIGSGADR